MVKGKGARGPAPAPGEAKARPDRAAPFPKAAPFPRAAPSRKPARRVALPVVASQAPLAAAQPLAAGGFSEWLRVTRTSHNQQREVAVPCAECRACCHSSLFIHIAPDERDTLAHIAPGLLFPAPGAPPGHLLMGYDRHGRCPMLTDAGCSIYEHRPRTCRAFDCRTVAATNMVLDQAQHAIAEQARRWRFEHPLPEDERQHAAVRAAAAFLVERGPQLLPDALPSHPLQLARLAIRIFELFCAPGTTEDAARPSDAELASAILRAMASHTAPAAAAAPARARASSVKRARPSRS